MSNEALENERAYQAALAAELRPLRVHTVAFTVRFEVTGVDDCWKAEECAERWLKYAMRSMTEDAEDGVVKPTRVELHAAQTYPIEGTDV